jgi:hypothetical protein
LVLRLWLWYFDPWYWLWLWYFDPWYRYFDL